MAKFSPPRCSLLSSGVDGRGEPWSNAYWPGWAIREEFDTPTQGGGNGSLKYVLFMSGLSIAHPTGAQLISQRVDNSLHVADG